MSLNGYVSYAFGVGRNDEPHLHTEGLTEESDTLQDIWDQHTGSKAPDSLGFTAHFILDDAQATPASSEARQAALLKRFQENGATVITVNSRTTRISDTGQAIEAIELKLPLDQLGKAQNALREINIAHPPTPPAQIARRLGMSS